MAKRVKGERWSAERAQRVVDAWERSGKSGAAFARSIGAYSGRPDHSFRASPDRNSGGSDRRSERSDEGVRSFSA